MAPAKDQLTQKGQKESSLWRSAFLLQESDSSSLCQFRQTGNSAALHNSQRQPDASASPAPAEAPPPPERVGSRYPLSTHFEAFLSSTSSGLSRAAPRQFPPLSCLSLHLAAAGLLIGPACAMAQTPASPAVPPVVSPAPAAPAEAAPSVQQVQINGNQLTDVDQRRRSTAAKIIVGRDEIEKFGDSTVGDLLKRLPGVTLSGTPGRGGNIRMRGLGGGYTQILLDGERVQGGLSLDSIDPDQIERIEILRAPTAETGARAIAGTINIITREGFTKRRNDVRASIGLENGRVQPRASWSREDTLGPMNYNITLSAFRFDRADASQVRTVNDTDDRTEDKRSNSARNGVHLGSKLQWKFDGGDTLMLMPMVVYSSGSSHGDSSFEPGALGTLPYSASASKTDSEFSLARVNSQWRGRAGEGTLEAKAGVGQSRNLSHSWTTEFDSAQGGDPLEDDRSQGVERTGNASAKYSLLLENDHSLVTGFESEYARRNQSSRQLTNGVPATADYGDDYLANSLRLAGYAQDEWNISPQWAAYAGLRWEGIRTQSEGSDGLNHSNLSSVWTPLLHAVYKFDPKSRDQIRISLTRSYRSPDLSDLIGTTWLAKGTNSETNPDRTGNPNLKPELATGVDLAYEVYLNDGGMLSANLFARRISDLMRTLTTAVPQGDGSTRWVASPQNIGNATTQGIELEAKFRLTTLWPEAPAVDVRSNASLYQSRVDGVPGPDNRLSQQAAGSLNLGADYKIPQTPVTVGGNVNWTPGYRTRLSENQWAVQSPKRVIDLYGLYQFTPNARVRLSASNLDPRWVETASTVGEETATTTSRSYINWALQLEMKL